MSEEPLRDRLTFHISLPEEATSDEAEAFWVDLADFLVDWCEAHPERGQWDPFMFSHTESCEDSDHCHGPGSRVERKIAAEALRVTARVIADDPNLSTCSHDVAHGLEDWLEGRADQINPPRG